MTFNKVSGASNESLRIHAHSSLTGNGSLISWPSVEKLFHKDLCQKSVHQAEKTFLKTQHLELGTGRPPAAEKAVIKNSFLCSSSPSLASSLGLTDS